MSVKQGRRLAEVREKIFTAVDNIADPIRQTLSPRGGNVVYEDSRGQINITNDGVTIIKNLAFEDPFESAILEIVRHASLKTNGEAGDATSTTVLLSSILIKEGLRLIESGRNGMDLKKEYESFAEKMILKLRKNAKKIKDDKDLFYIAHISANNDKEIAENVVKTIKIAGEDGMVFIEPSNTAETDIIEDTGFNIKQGMFVPELATRGFSATYMNVPVLVTDKKLYYAQEAETILNTCLKNGYREVVVIAQDFIGEALPFFVANHTKGNIRVLLVKEPNIAKNAGVVLEDLAVYLGGSVVSEKSGKIVDTLKMENFVMAKRVISDGAKTIISRDKDEPNDKLEKRISAIRKEIKKYGSSDKQEAVDLKERIASLTNGMVTIKVGGHTIPVVNEKIFRYEDAVNATRVALKHGYLVGGGLAMLQAFLECGFEKHDKELGKVYRKVAEANIRQIAINCGLSDDLVIDNIMQMRPENPNMGFNALTGYYDDLLENGVVDPLLAEEMAIRNAADVAGIIVSSGYFIVNKPEDDGKSTD